MFHGLRLEVVVHFVDIGRIVDHHCLNIKYVNIQPSAHDTFLEQSSSCTVESVYWKTISFNFVQGASKPKGLYMIISFHNITIKQKYTKKITDTTNSIENWESDQGLVSQKIVNRTITDLSYDHLPTKFATVSQNLSECFYDFRFTTCGYDVFFVRRCENRSIYPGRAPIR